MSEGLSADEAASRRALEQARLRKERREAKLKAGGSARLNKITGLGGREPIPSFEEPSTATTTSTSVPSAPDAPSITLKAPSTTHHDDPEEVDISQHYYETKATPRPGMPEPSMSEDQLRQMMLGFDRSNANTPQQGQPGQQQQQANDAFDEDPLMKMMSQMMAGGAGGENPFANMQGFPGMSGMPGMPPQQAQAIRDPYTSLWRLLHAIVALGLGLYIILFMPFSGTKFQRERAAIALMEGDVNPDGTPVEDDLERRKKLFFWTFATAETVLLTTRFFLDKNRGPPPGVVATVIGFLPPNIKGYVEVAMRYGQIFTTVRSDMLACIFVLGVAAWLSE